jgi:hypothetical protein
MLVTQLEIILRRVQHPTISATADDPLLLSAPSMTIHVSYPPRPSIQPFLAVIQRSAFRDEGSLFDSNPTQALNRQTAIRGFRRAIPQNF